MNGVLKESALAALSQAGRLIPHGTGRSELFPVRQLRQITPPAEAAMLDLIERIYAAAEEPRLWTDFLERLARALGGTVTTMVSEDFRAGYPSLMAGTRLDGVLSQAYEEYFSSSDANAGNGKSGLRSGRIVTGQMVSTVLDPGEKKQYDELLRSLNVEHQLGAVLFREHQGMSFISVLRPRRIGPFGDEETALLRKLVPHLQRALGLHAKLAWQLCDRAAVMEALDGVPVGILLLDACGRPLVVNRAASEMLADRDGLLLGPEGLAAATNEETCALRGLIMAAADAAAGSGTPAGRVLAVSRPSQRRAFCVLVRPLSAPSLAPGGNHPAVAVFLTDPDRRPKTDGDVLRSLYGFTPAESRVATELIQGERISEAAKDLGVSFNTARTHLKHLFEKTDTHSRLELVRLLLCSSCCSCSSFAPQTTHRLPAPPTPRESISLPSQFPPLAS